MCSSPLGNSLAPSHLVLHISLWNCDVGSRVVDLVPACIQLHVVFALQRGEKSHCDWVLSWLEVWLLIFHLFLNCVCEMFFTCMLLCSHGGLLHGFTSQKRSELKFRLLSSCSRTVCCVTWCCDSWGYTRFILNFNNGCFKWNIISGFALQWTMLTSAVDMPCASADRLLLVLTWELSHLNCLCDPLAWEHCSCVAKLQCEVDWPWLQLTVGCGEAVTILPDV